MKNSVIIPIGGLVALFLCAACQLPPVSNRASSAKHGIEIVGSQERLADLVSIHLESGEKSFLKELPKEYKQAKIDGLSGPVGDTVIATVTEPTAILVLKRTEREWRLDKDISINRPQEIWSSPVALSPDGRSIAYFRQFDDKCYIAILEMSTNKEVTVGEAGRLRDFLGWSGDGKSLLYYLENAERESTKLDLVKLEIESRKVSKLASMHISDAVSIANHPTSFMLPGESRLILPSRDRSVVIDLDGKTVEINGKPNLQNLQFVTPAGELYYGGVTHDLSVRCKSQLGSTEIRGAVPMIGEKYIYVITNDHDLSKKDSCLLELTNVMFRYSVGMR